MTTPQEGERVSGSGMRFRALCTDYDGTLARHGEVSAAAIAALERLRASGGRPVMVTGRILPELETVFPRLDLFDAVVAENGAVLYRPPTGEERTLAAPPPESFARELARRGAEPVVRGRVVVATVEPHGPLVRETIRDLGLDLHAIFNKGSVMVLPRGVDKATGLVEALAAIGVEPNRAVGIGDAENDLAFLALCGAAVAVSNALPEVKEIADLVTRGSHGDGVIEVIDALLGDDLAAVARRRAARP